MNKKVEKTYKLMYKFRDREVIDMLNCFGNYDKCPYHNRMEILYSGDNNTLLDNMECLLCKREYEERENR